MTEQTPERHWSTTRMTDHPDTEGLPSTQEEVVQASDDTLQELLQICEVPDLDPVNCIPCFAYAELQERSKQRDRERLAEMAPSTHLPNPEIPVEEPEERETPKLDALVAEEPEWLDSTPVERLRRSVEDICALMAEVLDGPPIPPRNVTTDELALLTVGAQRWVKITEAQGVELHPDQQKILDATKALVQRLNHG